MRKIVVGVLAVAALAGCSESGGMGTEGSPMWMRTAPQEAKLAYYQRACVAYGYTLGTPQMAQCMQAEALNAESRTTAAFDTLAKQTAAQQAAAPRMISTQCTQQGVFTNCNTW